MTDERSQYVLMSRDELLRVLDDIRAHVAEGDSFEGNLEYLMPEPLGLPEADFAVCAAYRIGNSMGQGGMRMVRGDLPS